MYFEETALSRSGNATGDRYLQVTGLPRLTTIRVVGWLGGWVADDGTRRKLELMMQMSIGIFAPSKSYDVQLGAF